MRFSAKKCIPEVWKMPFSAENGIWESREFVLGYLLFIMTYFAFDKGNSGYNCWKSANFA